MNKSYSVRFNLRNSLLLSGDKKSTHKHLIIMLIDQIKLE